MKNFSLLIAVGAMVAMVSCGPATENNTLAQVDTVEMVNAHQVSGEAYTLTAADVDVMFVNREHQVLADQGTAVSVDSTVPVDCLQQMLDYLAEASNCAKLEAIYAEAFECIHSETVEWETFYAAWKARMEDLNC